MCCLQLFPYHLADYVCRILRVTPFKYYCDLLYTVMREEKSYDQIPNFAVRPAHVVWGELRISLLFQNRFLAGTELHPQVSMCMQAPC